MQSRAFAAVLAAVALAPCTKRDKPQPDAEVAVASSSAASAPASAPADVLAPAAPSGSVGLVVQHVDSVCWIGPPPGETHRNTIGTDLLLEVRAEGAAKAARDFVFCPNESDGGKPKPRLDVWQNCRAYPSCKETGEGAVQCGKDGVSIVVEGGRTILRGPFGDREVAPFPMHVAPTKREKRDALVDC